jgi:DNA-binding transcriptional LysR family regulator
MPFGCHIVDMPASLPDIGGQTEVATLRTLRIAKHFPFFLAVAEEQNLHRAAERLNIAQSALSRRISDLERELGDTALFERQARGVAITEAGRVLAEDVRRILLDIEEAGRRVQRVARGDLGTLRLAFSEAMVRRPLLPSVLRRFRADCPEVDLRALPLTSDAQRTRLRGGEIDIGFVIEESGDAEDFATMRVGMDKFMLVVPTGHRLADVPVVGLRELAEEPLILPARGVSPRLFGRMMGMFDTRGISPRIAVEVTAVDIAYGLVAAGMGLAIVTAARPDRAPVDIVLKDLTDFDIPLPLSMIWSSDSQSTLIRNFVRTVEEEMAN